MGFSWPLEIGVDVPGVASVRLRRLRRRDQREWEDLKARNREWLAAWAATSPDGGRDVSNFQRVGYYDRQARRGALLPMAVEVDGTLAGEMHLSGLLWGPVRSGTAGYWIDRDLAGRGITPWSLAAVADVAVHDLGLHRVEALICPDNAASLRVVEKLGFVPEGIRRGAIFINGVWRDHRVFAVTAEDVLAYPLTSRLAAGVGFVEAPRESAFVPQREANLPLV